MLSTVILPTKETALSGVCTTLPPSSTHSFEEFFIANTLSSAVRRVLILGSPRNDKDFSLGYPLSRRFQE